jgi:hypothetical protein
MSAPVEVPRAHRRSTHRSSTPAPCAGDRPGLGGSRSGSSGAPRRHAQHMLRQHASVPRTLAHDDVCTNSPQPSLSAGARSAPCTERLEQREALDAFDIPTTKRQCVQVIRGAAHVGAPRHRRRARSARWQPGCRRRMGVARSATRRWKPAAAPPGAQGAQRPRSARSAETRAGVRCGDS